jgi:hypothetical protein
MKQKLPSYLDFHDAARAVWTRATAVWTSKVERSLAAALNAVARLVSTLAYELATVAYHRSLRALEKIDAASHAYDDSGWEREVGLRSGRPMRANRTLGHRQPALHSFSPRLAHRQNLPRPGSPRPRPAL